MLGTCKYLKVTIQVGFHIGIVGIKTLQYSVLENKAHPLTLKQ
jgi:hypothetical protein